ncbi:hypothetical protein AC1031_020650 [Aphanomyces cochlioides]|nr:hypothetical protein AC1031_020650 [Aphanomyces cochlioides]
MASLSAAVDPAKATDGVTLAYLRRFISTVGGRSKLEGLSTLEVSKRFFEPGTRSLLQSFPPLDDEKRPAEWYICHAWSETFLDVIDAVETLVPSTLSSVWLRFILFPTHAPPSSLQEVISSIPHVAVVWQDGLLLDTWCLVELFLAATTTEVKVLPVRSNVLFDQPPLEVYKSFMEAVDTISFAASHSEDKEALEAAFPDLDIRQIQSVLEEWISQYVHDEIEEVPSPTEQAQAWYEWGLLLHESFDWDAAEAQYERALLVFDPDSREAMRTEMQLAMVHCMQKKPQDAWETPLKRLLKRQQRLWGDQDDDAVESMVSLGYVYAESGQPALALPVLDKALEIRWKQLGPSDVKTLHVMDLLAGQYFLVHRYANAAQLYSLCLEQYKTMFGDNHNQTLTCESNLASVYMSQGHFSKAQPLLVKCLEMDIATHGLDDPVTMVSMIHVAEAHRCLGELMQAEWLVLSMWDRAKTLHGESSELALIGLAELGLVYMNQKTKDAADCLEQAFSQRKHLHPQAPTTLRSLYHWYFYLVDHMRFESLSNIAMLEQHLKDLHCYSETWRGERCHGCTNEIRGVLASCPECPAATWQYCYVCVKKRRTMCSHKTPFMLRKPPPRFLQEQRLELLVMTQQETLLDQYLQQYQAYCDAHHVPLADRVMQDQQIVPCGCFSWLQFRH